MNNIKNGGIKMRKYLLWKWNYPLRWHVRRIGLTEPYLDGTPNKIKMVKEVMRLTGAKLTEAYEFVRGIK